MNTEKHVYPGPLNPALELERTMREDADKRHPPGKADDKTATATATKAPAGDEAVDYETLTVVELKELAAKRGIHISSDMRKDEIIEALED